MESPSRTLTLSPPPPKHLLTTATRRSNGGDSANSPEFSFSNTESNSETTLHSADELFSHGFLLPLQLLQLNRSEPDTGPLEYEPGSVEPDPSTSASITSSGSRNSILTASKRWCEIFKRTEKKPANNIVNIWPFSRSRSAGNNSTRSKPLTKSNRKVSSAPCSRSNSSGESKSRKSWASSPGRPGVYSGRSSPVWHIKKSGLNRVGGSGNKGRVLKLNVPISIGHRQNLSCGSGESGGNNGGGGFRIGGYSGGNRGNNGNLFSLRGLFSKKSSTNTELTV